MHRGQSTLDRPYPTRTLLTPAPARRRAGYDTFTVKFIETEGKCGVGYATGANEDGEEALVEVVRRDLVALVPQEVVER